MKKIFVVVFLITSSALFSNSLAQPNTFEIVLNGNITDVTQYITAMNNADFSNYFYQNTRRKIVFESGVVIELLSVRELEAKGIQIQQQKFLYYNPNDTSVAPIYKLTEEGVILELHNKTKQSK